MPDDVNPPVPAPSPATDKSENNGSLGFPGNGKPTLVLDLDETLVRSVDHFLFLPLFLFSGLLLYVLQLGTRVSIHSSL